MLSTTDCCILMHSKNFALARIIFQDEPSYLSDGLGTVLVRFSVVSQFKLRALFQSHYGLRNCENLPREFPVLPQYQTILPSPSPW